MIDEEATYEAFRHYPSDLKLQSHKLILATCELCGEPRILRRADYRTFCLSCSHVLGEKSKGKNNRMFDKQHSKETKAKISASEKGMRVGENNPNWQGGISFEPYCVKFNNAFKDYIRAKFGHTCFLCPTTQAENGKKLSVHHVNYNKQCGCDGDKTCNFVPLCMVCHNKTNRNREYWQKLIMNKLHCLIIGWDV